MRLGPMISLRLLALGLFRAWFLRVWLAQLVPVARAEVLHGDCVELMRGMPDCSVDAVVCDPPYALEFMGATWDSFKVAERDDGPQQLHWRAYGNPYAPGPTPSYFGKAQGSKAEQMRVFQTWCEEWGREALRVLKPGGHLLAFGGTRTSHRLVCGLEEAGFEIRDTIAWMHGQGFPKSLNVGKAIDAAAGLPREVRRYELADGGVTPIARNGQCGDCGKWRFSPDPCKCARDNGPQTSDAAAWEGWGTALKPAHEPIVVARKPLAGTVASTVLAFGTGALNIDAARIAVVGETVSAGLSDPANRRGVVGRALQGVGTDREANQQAQRESLERTNTLGRWPANVTLSHDEACVHVGERRVPGHTGYPNGPGGKAMGFGDKRSADVRPDAWAGHADEDGMEAVAVWACVPWCAVRALDDQAGVRASGDGTVKRASAAGYLPAALGVESRPAGTPMIAYGDEGVASRFFYVAKPSRAEREAGMTEADELRPLNWSSGDENPGAFQSDGTDRLVRNDHPTLKPVELMRWLVRLVTPPGGLVLDPFAGSGTCGLAAGLEGFRYVGCEQDEHFAAIARKRIAWWALHGEAALNADRAVRRAEVARAAVADTGQLGFFG